MILGDTEFCHDDYYDSKKYEEIFVLGKQDATVAVKIEGNISNLGTFWKFSKCNRSKIIRSNKIVKHSSLKHAYIVLTPLNPTFIQLNWGLQGYTLIFLFLLKDIDCGYTLEPPRLVRIYVLSRNMKNIRVFIWKFSFCFVVKFSIYMYRHVFVMWMENSDAKKLPSRQTNSERQRLKCRSAKFHNTLLSRSLRALAKPLTGHDRNRFGYFAYRPVRRYRLF